MSKFGVKSNSFDDTGSRIVTASLAATISLAACNKIRECRNLKAQAVQKTFASPADAGAAFLEAAKSGDQSALLAIFGPECQRTSCSPAMR